GVDNTASTFGGLLWFLRKPEGNEFEKITVPKKYYIVMANSGPTANTKAAVAKVKTLKEEKPEFYLDIALRAENAAVEGRRALEKGDEKNAGLLMNINHTLLQDAGVSTPLLDMMVETARASGALGAKLTGGGLGGYMVALVPDPEIQKMVAESIKSLDGAITVLLTTIG
ncbi:MAG: mevalonate kinase, partial [Candidatus Thermoplasmatota archaeon]|nr:mevalonate kinase [Candidatus Thermoplasmatota archaeon]